MIDVELERNEETLILKLFANKDQIAYKEHDGEKIIHLFISDMNTEEFIELYNKIFRFLHNTSEILIHRNLETVKCNEVLTVYYRDIYGIRPDSTYRFIIWGKPRCKSHEDSSN